MLALFKRQLNVSTPNRDGYSQELFAQESQLYPPALYDSGKRHSGEMSDLLLCLKQQETAEQPQVYDCKIFDAVYAQPTTKAGTFKKYADNLTCSANHKLWIWSWTHIFQTV